MEHVKKHFNTVAKDRERWEKKNRYYYCLLENFLKTNIREESTVLEIGCGRGSLLKNLKSKKAFGIDISENMLFRAKDNVKEASFTCMDISKNAFKCKFDYIILSDVLGSLEDIQLSLEAIRELSHENTRIIITYFNYIYEFVFRVAEKLKLKMPQPLQSWISFDDVNSFLNLAGISVVKRGRMILFPKRIPLFSYVLNRFLANLPVLNHFCITQFWIGKLDNQIRQTRKEKSVSIIVPARNESGNIEDIVNRVPGFGPNSSVKPQIVFVEGGSTDDTAAKIIEVKKRHKDKDILFLTQEGKGKADADYKGMDNATGDIFMILDADMTVSPEELPKFYNAITTSNADLVMGSRLIYPMEDKAMRFLNLLGNKAFSLILSWLISQRIKDTLCGTKVLLKDKYLELKERNKDLLPLDPFGDFFFILGTARTQGKIVEIPIRYRERKYGSTNISRFKHGLYLLKMCAVAALKIKFR